jgi:hypothetical protein
VPKATTDPALAQTQLLSSLSVVSTTLSDNYKVQSITGWEYGLRDGYYCQGPYAWLDEDHVLLYPLLGEYDTGMGIGQPTIPVVAGLDNGQIWLPTENPTDGCDTPVWSNSLRRLVAVHGNQVVIYDPNGNPIKRHGYQGADRYLYLSPSGKRLLAGPTWIDLAGGDSVTFKMSSKYYVGGEPAWQSDEHRLFISGYADARTGTYIAFPWNELHTPGIDLPAGANYSVPTKWVLNDTRVLDEARYEKRQANSSISVSSIPLINPPARSYVDLMDRIPVDRQLTCKPTLSPNNQWVAVGCWATLEDTLPITRSVHLVNLQTQTTVTVSNEYYFMGWSPDGKSVLLVDSLLETTSRHYALYSLTGSILYPISNTAMLSNAWLQNGKEFAYLHEDNKTLTVVRTTDQSVTDVPLPEHTLQLIPSPKQNAVAMLATGGSKLMVFVATTHSVLTFDLPRSCSAVIWRPQGDSLALQAIDGNLLWLPDMSGRHVEQLTPSMPDVRDIHWSPSGLRLAYVGANDLHVISVINGPR